MQKIQHHIKAIFTMALAVVVLFSASGFSLYSHHCNHSHTVDYSIYLPVDACDYEQEESNAIDCCKPAVETCCSANNEIPEEDDCCTNTAKYVKLDVKTLLNQANSSINALNAIQLLACTPSNSTLFSFEIDEERKDTFDESPPPITTPQYLSFIQVYIL